MLGRVGRSRRCAGRSTTDSGIAHTATSAITISAETTTNGTTRGPGAQATSSAEIVAPRPIPDVLTTPLTSPACAASSRG